MTTWRHANEWHSDFTGLTHCMAPRDNGSPCECTTPTPDPASPCGHPECEHDARATWTHPPAGPYLHGSHPHVPTRCTCGDPIEEATR